MIATEAPESIRARASFSSLFGLRGRAQDRAGAAAGEYICRAPAVARNPRGPHHGNQRQAHGHRHARPSPRTRGSAPLCGGQPRRPPVDAAHRAPGAPPGALVLECSSYQLETLSPTPVDVAMVLNVSPDHLDRYDDLDHYARTKGRIFCGLRAEGLALTYAPDPRTVSLVPAAWGTGVRGRAAPEGGCGERALFRAQLQARDRHFHRPFAR